MKTRKGTILIILGLLLLAAALFLAAFNAYDSHRAQQSVNRVLVQLEEGEGGEEIPDESAVPPSDLQMPDYMRYPEMEMPVETVDGQEYVGILTIPALELELPVISQWSYPSLRTAPCRYSGSAYQNDLIICGHNYASHFGGLKNLQEGDLVIFTDMDGNAFTYQMVERETLAPTDVEEMESGDWDLTLFTCTVGGQTRVTVRFELVAPS